MVKIKASLLGACIALLAGCAGRQLLDVHPERLTIPAVAPGGRVSLALTDTSLLGIFSDTATTTLDQLAMPISEHLPGQPPAVSVIDKIDGSPPLSASFGEHVLLVHDGMASVLYQDRVNDVKMILKLGSRPIAGTQWYVDTLEPPGLPVALLAGDKGSTSAFWSSGGLAARMAPTAATTIVRPLSASLPGSIAGPAAFTAYDEDTHTLLLARRASDTLAVVPVEGGARIQSSLADARGRVTVLAWNDGTRRLQLLEERASPGKFSTTTVTLCEGTTHVQILPGDAGGTYLFLFDESVRRGGATVHQLSLIAPSSQFGVLGGRYRKAVLFSAEDQIKGFSAARTANALYVLVAGRDLSVLRVGLN